MAESIRVIVQKSSPADPAPELAVRRLGGQVTRALPIVAGFAATVPAARAGELAGQPGVRAVTPDAKVRVQAAAPGGGTIRSVYPKTIKADAVWKRGVTGRGVTVAVLDTGVANVPDLAGRLVQVRNDLTGQTTPCKNLSGELDCNDRYGHGTFIAGLVAGNGASSGGKWKGVAPEASVLSVKAAGADGAADVSNILAAIQWVVSFKDRYNIRVLNLSLGTDSTQDWRVDPLNYAVERAWAAGMTVVVAASNEGPGAGTITKPADDPWVVTVGATDDRGTAGLGDDQLPDFSGRGPTAHGLAKPDVAAPGAHVISLRAPGSTIDTQFPWYVDGSYRRGSGTSMATGVVSGAVALMLQANPGFTPDRVKHALAATAKGRRLQRPDGRRGRGGGRQRRRLLGPAGRRQPGPGPLQRPGQPRPQPRVGAGAGRRPARHRPRPGPRGHPDRPAPALEPGRLHRRPLGPLRLVPLHLGGPPLEPGELVRQRLAGHEVARLDLVRPGTGRVVRFAPARVGLVRRLGVGVDQVAGGATGKARDGAFPVPVLLFTAALAATRHRRRAARPRSSPAGARRRPGRPALAFLVLLDRRRLPDACSSSTGTRSAPRTCSRRSWPRPCSCCRR